MGTLAYFWAHMCTSCKPIQVAKAASEWASGASENLSLSGQTAPQVRLGLDLTLMALCRCSRVRIALVICFLQALPAYFTLTSPVLLLSHFQPLSATSQVRLSQGGTLFHVQPNHGVQQASLKARPSPRARVRATGCGKLCLTFSGGGSRISKISKVGNTRMYRISM